MPRRRALTTCTTPGCGVLVQSGRCDTCQRDADKTRGNGTQRGWTPQWAAFRTRYLRAHAVCTCDRDCCGDGCARPATDIDHLDGTGRTGARAYDETNLAALAHVCHSRKTVRSDGGFGR